MVMVNLDRERTTAIPSSRASRARRARSFERVTIDWEPLFPGSGSRLPAVRSEPPRWVPTTPYDNRAEWEGTSARHPETVLHVAAAGLSRQARLLRDPRSLETARARDDRSKISRPIVGAVMNIVVFTLLAPAMVLAKRNLRLGRGDRRGALRISAYVFLPR